MVFAIIAAAVLVLLVIAAVIDEIMNRRAFYKKIDNSFGVRNSDSPSADSADSYFYFSQNACPSRQVTDESTWNDLDMDKVYSGVNFCLTSVGDEYLFDLLHISGANTERLARREELIARLDGDAEARIRLRRTLADIGRTDCSGLAKLIFIPTQNKLKFSFVFMVLGFVPTLSLFLILLSPAVGVIMLTASFILNLFIHYFSMKKIERASAALAYLSAVLYGGRKICESFPDKSSGLIGELQAYVGNFKKLRRRLTVIMKSRSAGIDIFADYCNIFTLSSLRSYCTAVKEIEKNQPLLKGLFESLGEIDLAAGILSLRKSLSVCCIPEFTKRVEFTGMRHPLLPDSVPNDAVIRKNSIITGSNASGKSTFLKAVACNCIIAQAINTCTAETFCLYSSTLITALSINDNLMAGESFYVAELKILKNIIDVSRTGSTICFIDEILRGTNTPERISASLAYLKYIISLNTLAIAATHDLELAEALENEYENFHFSEDISGGEVYFDYKIKGGISHAHNAIKLLEISGFPKKIQDDAYRFYKDGLWRSKL